MCATMKNKFQILIFDTSLGNIISLYRKNAPQILHTHRFNEWHLLRKITPACHF